MKKKKYTYYICTLDSPLDAMENLEKLTVGDLRKMDFQYITGFFDENNDIQFSDDINNKNVLKAKKLFHLLQAFLVGDGDNEVDSETIDFRLDLLYGMCFVFKMDTVTKLLSLVTDDVIYNCIEAATAAMPSLGSDNGFKFESFTKPETKSINVDHLGIFTEQLDKCFGEGKSGIVTFFSENYGQEWDIAKTENGYSFGVDEKQNILFSAKLVNLFLDASSCTLRVFTGDIVNKTPVKELYAFILNPDFSIFNVPYLELKEAHTTHHATGEKMIPEKNVVYCDVEGNRLCSADVES